MKAPTGNYREESGFTILQMVVVLFIVGLMTYAFSGAFTQQIDNARITAMITNMRQMANDAQVYHNSIADASIDANGAYHRNLRSLPSAPNQIAKFNQLSGSHYATTNQFGEKYSMRQGAHGRVFVASSIPVSAVGGHFSPNGASVSRSGSEYQISVMALSDGGPDYGRKSRAYKSYLEGKTP